MSNAHAPAVVEVTSGDRARTVRGTPLDPADLDALRALIEERGLLGAARVLGLPRNTLAGGAAGAGLRQGTRLQIVAALRAHAGGDKA